jgi:hypothetical protein
VIWRVVNHGFFTYSRGALWGKCSAKCHNCSEAQTTAHMFFDCHYVQDRWRQLFQLFSNTSLSFGRPHAAFDVIQTAVQAHSKNPVLLILAAETIWTTWTERTMLQFQSLNRRVPIVIILRRCLLKVEALRHVTSTAKKLEVLTEAADVLQCQISQFHPLLATFGLLN